MTGMEVAAVMASSAALVTAIGGVLIGLRKLVKIERQGEKIGHQTDGMHKEVVAEVRKAAALLAEIALVTSDRRAAAAHDAGLLSGMEVKNG